MPTPLLEAQDCQLTRLTVGFALGVLHVCRKEAVTLPENEDIDVEGMLNFSNGATTMFQQTSYFSMVSIEKFCKHPND